MRKEPPPEEVPDPFPWRGRFPQEGLDRMKHRLVAIDVDGTLLGTDHDLVAGAADAIAAARRAGMQVVLATGRTYAETVPLWRRLAVSPPFEPMVLIGGALVSEPDTGRTLYHKPMKLELAARFADAVADAGYAAMAIVDPWRHGWDYLLCETGDVHAVRRDWLSKIHAKVRRVGRLREAADMPDPLRVNVVAEPDKAGPLAAELSRRFNGELNVHAIVAPNYNVTIVEAFAIGADKHSALRYVAQAHRLGAGQTVAIGDDVNDLTMIRGAGLGVAMAHAPDEVRAAADIVVDSLPDFLGRLVAGEFD
jgi:Cof subfamily protein (haloacid dehalogenase superfamily)